MSGIIFKRTTNMNDIINFYKKKLGLNLWLDQNKCKLLSKGNLLIGFCKSDEADTDGIITFFYNSKKEVDKMYTKLKDISTCKPRINEDFNIYQFFAEDPEGRTLEFQYFLHDLNPYLRGDEILRQRRSFRKYKDKPVPQKILDNIFYDCKYSPTSMNSQSYYFIVVRNKEKIKKLSEIRGSSSRPIAEGSLAVAICASKKKTKRIKQDGDIAAYHFMLSAFNYGLGTCWIADMNREKVKKILKINEDDYVATVTSLGYPKNIKKIPERRKVDSFVKYLN